MRYALHKTGTQLVRQGEAGESMFIVTEGLLNVMYTSPDTLEMTNVGSIQSGGFFGEMSLMTGEPRSATVVAATDTVVYEIAKDEVGEILASRPELAETISKVIAKRRVATEARLAANSESAAEEQASLAQQILGKIRFFFRGVLPPRESALEAAT
jgi:CRP-like cAMP-binding protein